MKLLEASDLSKTYRGAARPALRDAAFSIGEGNLLAIVGESGSGKTTLLRLLAGLETPDTGSIQLDGRAISTPGRVVPPEKRGVGMVFQHHALFPHLTVAGNIAFGIRRRPSAEQRETIHSLLELVGLPGFEKRFPHQLSGGERQRVALARSLAPGPRLLLMDEPFSSLDPRLRDSLRDETRAMLKRHGTTAILVTHDTADALTVADDIVVLKEGVIQQAGNPVDIYGAPANAYVATFFGTCNFIPPGHLPEHGHFGPDSADRGLWVRPEQLALAGPDTEGLKGIVRHIAFMGSHAEVTLECTCVVHGTFTVMVRHPGGHPPSPGDTRKIVVSDT